MSEGSQRLFENSFRQSISTFSVPPPPFSTKCTIIIDFKISIKVSFDSFWTKRKCAYRRVCLDSSSRRKTPVMKVSDCVLSSNLKQYWDGCDIQQLEKPTFAEQWSCDKSIENDKVPIKTKCEIVCPDGYDILNGRIFSANIFLLRLQCPTYTCPTCIIKSE